MERDRILLLQVKGRSGFFLKKKGAPDELPAKKEDRPGRIEKRTGLIFRSPPLIQKNPSMDSKSLMRFFH